MSEMRRRKGGEGEADKTTAPPSLPAAPAASLSASSAPSTAAAAPAHGLPSQSRRKGESGIVPWLPLLIFGVALFSRFYRLDCPPGVVFGARTPARRRR